MRSVSVGAGPYMPSFRYAFIDMFRTPFLPVSGLVVNAKPAVIVIFVEEEDLVNKVACVMNAGLAEVHDVFRGGSNHQFSLLPPKRKLFNRRRP